MLPIIYMLWLIECFDFNVLLFKELMLLVSQKNVCVCVGRWVGACMHACVHCYC